MRLDDTSLDTDIGIDGSLGEKGIPTLHRFADTWSETVTLDGDGD